MHKMILLTITLLLLTGCAPRMTKVTSTTKTDILTKIKNQITQQHPMKEHSAIAIAMIDTHNYKIGYAYDAASTQSAEKIALKRCAKALKTATTSHNAHCDIYVVDGATIRTLN